MKTCLTSIFLMLCCLVSAQPEMTIWRVITNGAEPDPGRPQIHHHGGGHHGGGHHAHAVEEWFCGERYYFTQSDNESVWSIKNEGNENLTLSLPLTFTEDGGRIQITVQPDRAVLSPGEETEFRLKYNPADHDIPSLMQIKSDDPSKDHCFLMVDGGVGAFCNCHCENGQAISRGDRNLGPCPNNVGWNPGIIMDRNQCPAEGASCSPVRASDPCNCNNTLTLSNGTVLFRDTLVVNAASNLFVNLTDNTFSPNGFVDDMGNTISPRALGRTDGTGELRFVFYRYSGAAVDIRYSGQRFFSPACNLADCQASTIPTLSEWGLILLMICLVIVGVIGYRSRVYTTV